MIPITQRTSRRMDSAIRPPYFPLQYYKMKNYSGFTLIEILIAMVVLAFGLLGLAGLQASGLKNNMSSANRSQATQLAYDIADRMRANNFDASLFGGSKYITVAPTAAVQEPTCTTTAGCTAAQMAEQDLYEWNIDLAASLPLGQGTITVGGGLYIVTINWDDNRDGCVNPGDPAAGCAGKLDDPNFIMRFQI